jgi:hypothetical protein
MTHNSEPRETEIQADVIADISTLTDHIIQTRGTTVAMDEYEKRSPGTPVSIPFDKSYSSNGMVEFGKRFDVYRKVVGQIEVVYARNVAPEKSELLVNKFDEQSGLDLRAWFTQRNGKTYKRLELPPWGAQEMNPHSFIELSDNDGQALLIAMQNPEEHVEAILAIVEPSEEELALLEESRERILESKERFNSQMESIREAEREAARHMRDVITD